MKLTRRGVLKISPLLGLAVVCLAASLSTHPAFALSNASTATKKVYAASQFKAPTSTTPTDVAQKWAESDSKLRDYIASNVPAVLEHTGSSAFDEHLRGVQAVLRYWGAPEHLTSAGLFHSIYGTEGFQGFSLPLSERAVVKDLIGEKAERLCWIFCMVDRSTVDKTVFSWSENGDGTNNQKNEYTFTARPELGRFDMRLNHEEWLDFIELTLADWMEQVQGAAETSSDIFLWKKPGDAYAYRRDAYKRMSQLLSKERAERLSDVVPAMHRAVMDTEGEETRNLVQPRTPPMSQAAMMALDALRSAGEDIPLDLGPVRREVAKECARSSQ